MTRRTSVSVAKKAHAKAEADFSTWLMMAKLGSFDDLPPEAQRWLATYRTRLEVLPEQGATSATIKDMYIAYYTDMGGTGSAPDPVRPLPRAGNQAAEPRLVHPAHPRAIDESMAERPKRSMPTALIFAGMVAALVAIKFAFGN